MTGFFRQALRRANDDSASLTKEKSRLRTEADSRGMPYERLSLAIECAAGLDGSELLSSYLAYCDSNPSYEHDWDFWDVVVYRLWLG